MIRNRLRTTAL